VVSYKSTENFIKNNSGNSTAFDAKPEIYNNVQEVEGSAETRQQMVDVVNQDNGNGGTDPGNNREYGGTVSNDGAVKEAQKGDVTTPESDNPATINITAIHDTKSEFHSHPSGTTSSNDQDRLSTGSTSRAFGSTENHSYHQAPSDVDVKSVGNRTGYTFGMGGTTQTVYIYNKNGVTATIPLKHFVNPKK
jgi:hypothetical protein